MRAAPPSAPHLAQAPFSAAGLQARQAQRAVWQQRLERAQGALDAYRHSSRYPHGSQPLDAHPDQAYPNEPIGEERPLGMAAPRRPKG